MRNHSNYAATISLQLQKNPQTHTVKKALSGVLWPFPRASGEALCGHYLAPRILEGLLCEPGHTARTAATTQGRSPACFQKPQAELPSPLQHLHLVAEMENCSFPPERSGSWRTGLFAASWHKIQKTQFRFLGPGKLNII